MKTASILVGIVSLLLPCCVMGRLDLLRVVRQQHQDNAAIPPRTIQDMDEDLETEITLRGLMALPAYHSTDNSLSFGTEHSHSSSGDYYAPSGEDVNDLDTPGTTPAYSPAPVPPAPPSTPVSPPTSSPAMYPVPVPTTAMTEAPATSPSEAPMAANAPAGVNLTDDWVIDDDASTADGGILREPMTPVQIAPNSSSSSRETTAIAAESSTRQQVENSGKSTPSQTAMIVILAIAAAAVGAAGIAHKIYIGRAAATGSSAISESPWVPADGAAAGSAPPAGVQGSAGINA